ncbi:MAG TPA: HypC/HybG/HupF family hydrogenase formation chaperone [Elusimicrobia bacterium]|nr:HypC/HybG/HupF family hydrogenase formation chaperone [Elusimicrobiota bacterium]
MCLAVPGKIISLKNGDAEVDFNGVKRAVSLDLVPDARKNDYVLVHAGFAIQVLEPKEAEETLKLFEEIYGKDHGDALSGPLSHIKP